MRHARHDNVLNAAETVARANANIKNQRYIIIVFDGPDTADREASYSSNVEFGDVAGVCEAVAHQIRNQMN